MGSMSIWTQAGRLERFKIDVDESRLATLKLKRIRQLKRLARKYEPVNQGKARRLRGRRSRRGKRKVC